MKYRKKPVVIEAFRYDGDFKGADNEYYVPQWAVDALNNETMYYSAPNCDEPPRICERICKEGRRRYLNGVQNTKGQLGNY